MDSHKEHEERLKPTRNLRDGVVRSVDRGASGTVDEEWEMSILFVLNDEFLQLCWNHLSSETFQ